MCAVCVLRAVCSGDWSEGRDPPPASLRCACYWLPCSSPADIWATRCRWVCSFFLWLCRLMCLSGDACKTCRDQNRKGVLPQGLRPRLGVVYMQPMHVAALQHKGRLVTSMQQ